MNYTHEQLKQALAKMLPDDLMIVNKLTHPIIPMLYWKGKNIEWEGEPVLDTELLHLCVMVEDRLEPLSEEYYFERISKRFNWQQRVIKLAEVKGIEI